MGEQMGTHKLTGRVGAFVYYKSDGKYLVRAVSSLRGKQFKKDKRFRNTMMYAGLLARASKIGSAVYNAIPKDARMHTMYRAITGAAMKLLKNGTPDKEALIQLRKIYLKD